MKPPTIDEIAKAIGYTPNEADNALWDGLVLEGRRTGTVGATADAFAIAMMWITWNRPNEVCLVVTHTKEEGEACMELIEHFIHKGIGQDFRLGRILISKSKTGLGFSNFQTYSVVHVRPVDLGVALPDPKQRYTILVPDMNRMPGCYLRDAASQKGNVLLAVNVPK